MSRPALLRAGGFRKLLIGQGVSALGDWMGTFALIEKRVPGAFYWTGKGRFKNWLRRWPKPCKTWPPM